VTHAVAALAHGGRTQGTFRSPRTAARRQSRPPGGLGLEQALRTASGTGAGFPTADGHAGTSPERSRTYGAAGAFVGYERGSADGQRANFASLDGRRRRVPCRTSIRRPSRDLGRGPRGGPTCDSVAERESRKSSSCCRRRAGGFLTTRVQIHGRQAGVVRGRRVGSHFDREDEQARPRGLRQLPDQHDDTVSRYSGAGVGGKGTRRVSGPGFATNDRPTLANFVPVEPLARHGRPPHGDGADGATPDNLRERSRGEPFE
jgi:hypothetical protein